MDSESISPVEFRKLQLQVDILQRFLTKTFGSSFLDFCKQAQLSSTSTTKGTSKPLPPLNKAQLGTNGTSHGNEKAEVSNNRPTPAVRRLHPPPLLHRPSSSTSVVSTKGVVSKGNNVVAVSRASSSITATVDIVENDEDYIDEGNDEDMVQFIQPETVFSDDENGSANSPAKKSNMSTQQTSSRKSVKRGHNVAFGYEDTSVLENGNNMQLPEGTECIVLDSDVDDQGQQENYAYQQDDELYQDIINGGEEMYDEDGYSYSMVDDGLEMAGNDGGNYQTEELQTDGNVTFGTVITAQDTGMQYFQCAFCPSAKVFKHKQSLKEHYLLNHSPTPPAYQCQCGRRFLKQSQLKRHEVVHTAERPYVCPICGKDFTRKDNMTVHMVRNHAEKKHKCPVCPDKIYATTAEVNRHLRMYHSQWQP